MNVSNEELFEIVKTINQIMFANQVEALHSSPEKVSFALSGGIRISGAWNGFVYVHSSEDIIEDIAAKALEKEREALSQDEVFDAMAELTNLIGGNIKPYLGSPSELSLATVYSGKESNQLISSNQNEPNRVDVLVNQGLLRVEIVKQSV